jgi:hypothetical protein
MAPGPETNRLRRVARAVRGRLPLVCFLAVVVGFYVFLQSAGHWTGWPTWTLFLDPQAEGFRLGHLYLPEVPSRALQALPDPLNPAHMTLWRWDRSYYKGHFYIYWGLVPALLLAAVKVAFRVRGVVTDDVIVFVAFLGRLLAGTFLIRALARRIEPRPALWAVALALGVFALAHPTPYTLARGGVYEAAIGAGAFFMVAGLGFGLRGIFAVEPGEADPWLVAASVCMGLAGGSRASLLPGIALLVGFTAFARWRIDGGERGRLVRLVLVACAPAALLTAGHLLLNRLRYDAWTEFGARYQMGKPFTAGLRFLVPDLFAYLFCPPTHRCAFPFLFGLWNTTRPLSPSWLSWPADHNTDEPSIGLLVVVVFVWVIPGWLLVALARRLRGARRRDPLGVDGLHPSLPSGPQAQRRWRWRWVWGALGLYTVGGALPLFFLSSTTMRYEADFASGLLLIATLCGWHLLAAPACRKGRVAAGAAYAALALATIVAGVLLGCSGGYFEQFHRHNPQLIHRLERALSVCGRA